MARKRLTHIILLLLAIVLLAGCSLSKNVPDNANMDRSSDAVETSAIPNDLTSPNNQLNHIEKILEDNHFIDADVYVPESTMCSSYILEPLQISPEVGGNIFFPEDKSTRTIEESAGITVLSTAVGNRFSSESGIISFQKGGEHAKEYMEVENLLWEYAKHYPETQANSLDFIEKENAVSLGKEILKALGISFDPVLETYIALDHQQLVDYQKELLASDSTYNEFGKAYLLPELSDKFDSCLLAFSFYYRGLPVYGQGDEAPVYVTGNVPFPISSGATMMISREGIVSFSVCTAFKVNDQYEQKPILSVDEVINLYQNKSALVILTGRKRVSSICLEYLPVESDDRFLLAPYYCFSTDREHIGLSGERIWSESKGERFNAFTGADLAYGG